MNWTLFAMIVLIVSLVVAPLIALRMNNQFDASRFIPRRRSAQDDEEDPDKPTGLW